jgi:hypothetical protein
VFSALAAYEYAGLFSPAVIGPQKAFFAKTAQKNPLEIVA